MKTLTLPVRLVADLVNFYSIIPQTEISIAEPTLGVRALIRVEKIKEDIEAQVSDFISLRNRVQAKLEALKVAFATEKEANGNEVTEEMLKKWDKSVKDTVAESQLEEEGAKVVTVELADEKFDLALSVFDKISLKPIFRDPVTKQESSFFLNKEDMKTVCQALGLD